MLALLFWAGLAGCSDGWRYVKQEELFFIDLGKMDRNINLFHDEGEPFNERSDIRMEDGLVWVLNRNANKIMTFTSYGDLVSLLYDPDENPVPVNFTDNDSEDLVSSRRAIPYQFNRIGWFALDSNRNILVEDQLPRDRWKKDDEMGVMLNRIILRFSSKGEPIDYLGQDGPRGMAFPYIYRMEITRNDEIVVVSRVPDRWLVYWFSPGGQHISTVEIPVYRLPMPEENLVPSLQDIFADPKMRRIYLKIDYYQRKLDDITGGVEGVDQVKSMIYWMDLEEGVYREGVEVPRNVVKEGDSLLDQTEQSYSYTLLGVPDTGLLLLMSEEPDGVVQLVLLRTDGKVIRRRYIEVPQEEVVFRRLHLGHSGILVGLFGYSNGAAVHWWRTDAMLPYRR